MVARTKRTTKKERESIQEKFLSALAQGFSVTNACEAAGIGRTAVYDWRNTDDAFKALWDDAIEQGSDVLEDAARRRALEGITRNKPIFHNGVQVGTEVITEYSDTLMIFLLKARRPTKYRDNVKAEHIHSGPDGGPIRITEIIVERPPEPTG